MVHWKILLCISIVWAAYLKNVQTQGNGDKSEIDEEESPIIQYKKTVTTFCEAMNAVLAEEEKEEKEEKVPTELNKTLKQLDEFTPSYLKFVNPDDLGTILEYAKAVLLYYQDHLVGKKRPYLVRTRHFRLLEWFRHTMRYNDDINPSFERTIDDILKKREDDTQPKNLLTEIFPKWRLREDCLKVKTLDKLEHHGRTADEIVDFCVQLAQNKGDIDKVNSEAFKIELTGNEQSDRKLCDEARHKIENFIRYTLNHPDEFKRVFHINPLEMQLLLNEAIRKKCKIDYERAEIDRINLNWITEPSSPLYVRNTMILYNHAVEKMLLPEVQKFDEITHILELENFPIGSEEFREFEMATLYFLSNRIIRGYDKQIKRSYDCRPPNHQNYDDYIEEDAEAQNQGDNNKPREVLSESQKECYSRLLVWAYNHISKAGTSYSSLATNMIYNLEHEWRSPTTDYNLDSNDYMYKQMNKSFDEVATFNALIAFCETGNLHQSSSLTTIQAEYQESAVIQQETTG